MSASTPAEMPAFPALDHVVLLVRDFAAASDAFSRAGFTVQRRAEVSDKPGSSFRFVSFDDGSYLLLNAFSDAAMACHWRGPLLREREGPGERSVSVAGKDGVIANAAGDGVVLGAENALTNVLATGEAWGLRLRHAGRGSGGDDALPFIVRDTRGRAARIPVPRPHVKGATGIARLDVTSADPAGSARRLAGLIRLPAPDGPVLAAGGAAIRFVPADPAGLATASDGARRRAGRHRAAQPDPRHSGRRLRDVPTLRSISGHEARPTEKEQDSCRQ